ncbi:DUF397 domain-containing protein [Streptomyces sp. NRRL S-37]|uniref:DUF397 domain-containing protein n=1 Tax=Streptomyces sp. NRRL S-37 TaxID=1463903 RepID=UPI0004C620D6|nr:DUF397 domain-containing protein [Streptomyces sp. NRRL S-37]
MSRTPDLGAVSWRKSSYSEGGADNCVEVAEALLTVVPVRDSKVPHGPVLRFPASAWTAFLGELKESRSPMA